MDYPGNMPGGILSTVLNLPSRQTFVISTCFEEANGYWTTAVIPCVERRSFFGLLKKSIPLWDQLFCLGIRNSLGDAHRLHAMIKSLVSLKKPEEWTEIGPDPMPVDGLNAGAQKKLKGMWGASLSPEIEERFQPEGGMQLDSIDALGAAIANAWAKCGEAIRPMMAGPSKGEQIGHYILSTVEFFYFFIHMTDRYALPILGLKDRDRLMGELVPLSVDYVVKVLFKDFDEDYQRHVRQRLPNGVSERDAYYSSGVLSPPDDADSSARAWVVTMLVAKVHMQSGQAQHDPEIVGTVIKAAIEQMIDLNLEVRIREIRDRS